MKRIGREGRRSEELKVDRPLFSCREIHISRDMSHGEMRCRLAGALKEFMIEPIASHILPGS